MSVMGDNGGDCTRAGKIRVLYAWVDLRYR